MRSRFYCSHLYIYISKAGGCRDCHSSAANEDGYDILRYRSGTLDRRTTLLHFMFLSCNGTWLTQEPPCRFVFHTVSNQTKPSGSVPCHFSACTVFAICSQGTCRCFSGDVHDSLLSGLLGLFLHVRCTPHQSSLGQF